MPQVPDCPRVQPCFSTCATRRLHRALWHGDLLRDRSCRPASGSSRPPCGAALCHGGLRRRRYAVERVNAERHSECAGRASTSYKLDVGTRHPPASIPAVENQWSIARRQRDHAQVPERIRLAAARRLASQSVADRRSATSFIAISPPRPRPASWCASMASVHASTAPAPSARLRQQCSARIPRRARKRATGARPTRQVGSWLSHVAAVTRSRRRCHGQEPVVATRGDGHSGARTTVGRRLSLRSKGCVDSPRSPVRGGNACPS